MDLLFIVLPVIIIFAVGFIGQKFLKMEIKPISTLALYIMIPFLTFDTFYSNELNINYLYLFIFAAIHIGILTVLTFCIVKGMKADKAHSSSVLLGSLFPNSGNYGTPVVLFAYGTVAFDYAVVLMVIHGIFINTLGIFIASYGGEKGASMKEALVRTAKMPVLYGMLLGVTFQLAPFEVHPNIIEGIGLVGDASIPTVMLILGMQLAEIKPQKFIWKYVNTVVLMRMVASPLVAAVLVTFMPVDGLIKAVFILLAAMPVAANTTMLAVQFNVEAELISFTTLITTLLSIITIPLTLYLL